jgi:PKD repeat protein
VVTASVNVRQAPSTSAPIFTTEVMFRQGIIVAGSTLGDGYRWWEVSWDDNFTGWSAEGSNGTAWIQNLTGRTVAFDRAAALAYAVEYWNVVTSDGYFWNGPDSYVQYAQGTSVVGLNGDDCAHFVSQVIGDEPHQAGGGLNIPSRVPPTYGEPSAPDLGNMILNNGWGIQVNGTDQLEVGDVINYEWNPPDGTWDHISVYLGNGEVAAHTDSNYGVNWTLGGAYAYRFIHILATSTGGSGIDHPLVSLTLSPSSGTAPLTVDASASVVGGSGTYGPYLFEWGDGTSTTSASPTATHEYLTGGTYDATVRVTDSLGATGWAANQTVTAGAEVPLSVALTASSTTGTAPAAISFTAAPTGGSAPYASFLWAFGDGTSSTTATAAASHSYGSAGTFDASVTVTDSTGTTASSSPVPIVVAAAPEPLSVTLSSNRTAGPAPAAVLFGADPTGGSGSYGSYVWSFGDGSSGQTTAPSIAHVYAQAGTYDATVQVADGETTATSAAVAITISAASSGSGPLMSVGVVASPPSGTAPFTTTFTITITGGVAPYQVAWTFGDGTSGTSSEVQGGEATISHTFGSTGRYSVTAEVTDGAGGSVSATLTVSATTASASGSVPSSSPSIPILGSAWVLLGILTVAGVAGAGVVAAIVSRRRRRNAEAAAAPLPEVLWPGPPL